MSVPICTHTDAVDLPVQDCLPNIHATRLVGNLACSSISCLTITCCCPTCLIPTEIKFDALCEKIDVVNKAVTYVIKFVAWIVTVLSFICLCVVVADIFYSFYLEPVPIVHPMYKFIIVVITHLPATINCATGSTQDTAPYNSSIMANSSSKLHIFKTKSI